VDGGPSQDITIDYDLYLNLKVLGITVHPTISNSATFPCPISATELKVSNTSSLEAILLVFLGHWGRDEVIVAGNLLMYHICAAGK
jgi:hypothetical protein